ncbi:ligand-dependent corepressor-like isoform X4 [Cololabis saira]|uniref:ligand-dependent corepressor-like isoform X4 n=1 Tax=Cololabis saira TaxID=129043 RepID=UPI002AD37B1A|nr:ligand-dependent corepressor-like isoform X4 [Cololabis saira]
MRTADFPLRSRFLVPEACAPPRPLPVLVPATDQRAIENGESLQKTAMHKRQARLSAGTPLVATQTPSLCFENILKGLIGPTLVEDLKFFKELEPVAVSDWSFDENCLFCCLKRDKVKERLIGSSKGGIEDTHRRLLVKDQITIIRFEKQTEEFLSAVLCRKDVPSFSDPHIPVVAREVLQRMISQFAVEYTSKTSSPQGSHSDYKPLSDQSPSALSVLTGPPPPSSPSATVAGPAHNQNPVLSKLLMGDQDAPLDLTMKKLLAEPSEQDGVLDLSMKKKPISAVRSPCLSPATPTLKRGSLRADGQVGLFMKSLQDGRRKREDFGHSDCYKPSSSFANSLHIKAETDLESNPESLLSHNHKSISTDLFRNGSSSWNSKSHFGTLIKHKTSSEANDNLKDIPKLLETAGLCTKSLSTEQGSLKETWRDQGLSLSHSSFDLKIPQVRVLSKAADLHWKSVCTKYSGSLCENGHGKKLCSILPRQIQKRSSVGSNSSGSEREYWTFPAECQSVTGNHSMDSESDQGNKQPRKKRGRYRQYNTELLEEAIVVVMGGKMSVSKAQSIYGIPHSTLEYKVKERLGTLKHPPKKKMKLISQVEGQDVSLCPDGKEFPNSLVVSVKHENSVEDDGSDAHDGSHVSQQLMHL